MITDKKIFSMLSLCQKAGKIFSGEFMCEKSIKSKEALFVIVALDASENTKKKFKELCNSSQIPLYLWGTKEELGRSIGKDDRASLAIRDPHFAKKMEQLLQDIVGS